MQLLYFRSVNVAFISYLPRLVEIPYEKGIKSVVVIYVNPISLLFIIHSEERFLNNRLRIVFSVLVTGINMIVSPQPGFMR